MKHNYVADEILALVLENLTRTEKGWVINALDTERTLASVRDVLNSAETDPKGKEMVKCLTDK